MPTCHANGIDIYYEQQGAGPHLILISGYTADHRSWEKIFDDLAKDFTVTVFDNRGIGQTSAPSEPYTTKLMAEDTLALMVELTIHDAFVVGHSMGGGILLHMLLQQPEAVKKSIVLCSGILKSSVKALHYDVNNQLMQQGVPLELVIKNAMTFLLGETYLSDPSNIDYFVDLVVNDPHPMTPAGYMGQRHALFEHNIVDQLEHIQSSVVSIGGGQDLLNPLIHAQTIAAKIPNAEYDVVEKSGHIPQIEQPQVLVDKIKAHFLSE